MDLTLFLQQMVNGFSFGSMYALIAIGYTMVYGIIKLINFAHGDIFMIGAFAGFFAVTLITDFLIGAFVSSTLSNADINMFISNLLNFTFGITNFFVNLFLGIII